MLKREGEARIINELNSAWKFIKAEVRDAELIETEDSNWQEVRVPHDWAIKGPFARENDLQHISILEDGINKKIAHTGRTGGLPVFGTAWYRRNLFFNKEDKNKKVFIEFDGVMSNSTVYLNGKKIGSWPYGYSSFSFELTEYINYEQENILAVRVSPKPCASRWYPGAGIYRKVRLVYVNPIHIAHWGTYITTPKVTEEKASVKIRTEIENQNLQKEKVELLTYILNHKGEEIASCVDCEIIKDKHFFQQSIEVDNPIFWDIDNPKLYKAVSLLKVKGEIVDKYETNFGIRTINFDVNKGFFLNGRNVKLKGVCQHHDLGPLGSAVNKRAIERQLEILKDMGCNAIRTSHNPPTPELLDLCDHMGFLVIDEAFDEWKAGKVDNGYHKLFDDWAEKDLRAMIKRDGNHPSIIMWSIGNEIREQGLKDGAKVAKYLTEICHDQDPSRLVTAGFNNAKGAIKNGLADAIDVVGWNYEAHNYKKFHKEHPNWITYGSETESCLSSRGEYIFPVEEEKGVKPKKSLQISSYDLSSPPWGYPPDYEFKAQEECPFILGEFVWTGFDYIGEPTPYYEEWPSRSSYFGIIDLCGIPKDRYYLYRSHWSNKPTLHLLPHWNWQDKEGEIIPVYCYTNYDSAELFLNGKSLGIKKKDPKDIYKSYRLIWDNVKYEAGTLKVLAYDKKGNVALSKEIKTADNPAKIELKPDRKIIKADGEDLSFITVEIVDKEGNLCPLADNLVSFMVKGEGEIVAVGSGDPTSTEPFMADYRQAFNGKCMLIVRSLYKKGKIIIKAEAEGLKGKQIELETK